MPLISAPTTALILISNQPKKKLPIQRATFTLKKYQSNHVLASLLLYSASAAAASSAFSFKVFGFLSFFVAFINFYML